MYVLSACKYIDRYVYYNMYYVCMHVNVGAYCCKKKYRNGFWTLWHGLQPGPFTAYKRARPAFQHLWTRKCSIKDQWLRMFRLTVEEFDG